MCVYPNFFLFIPVGHQRILKSQARNPQAWGFRVCWFWAGSPADPKEELSIRPFSPLALLTCHAGNGFSYFDPPASINTDPLTKTKAAYAKCSRKLVTIERTPAFQSSSASNYTAGALHASRETSRYHTTESILVNIWQLESKKGSQTFNTFACQEAHFALNSLHES